MSIKVLRTHFSEEYLPMNKLFIEGGSRKLCFELGPWLGKMDLTNMGRKAERITYLKFWVGKKGISQCLHGIEKGLFSSYNGNYNNLEVYVIVLVGGSELYRFWSQ